MNQRQAQNFLYEWGKRREGGIRKTILKGAGIGAIGGICFGALFWALSPNLSISEDELAPFLILLARAIGPVAFLFLMTTGAFAGLGAFAALAVWRKMEAQYHQLLAAGVRPATEKPVYTLKDRAGGLIVVGVSVLVLIGLLYGVWWELNRGSL